MKKLYLKIIGILLISFLLGSPALADQRQASANLTLANDAVTLKIIDCGTAGIQLTGTWSGTVTFEGTDGSTWVSIPAELVTTGVVATTTTTNGLYKIGAGGYTQIRARFSTATSGTVNTVAVCANGVSIVDVASGSISALGSNAHSAAALQSNPVITGFEAVNSDGTPPPNHSTVVEGDTARAISDVYGRQFVSIQHPNSWCATEEETGAVTNDEIKAAPGAGLSLYVCSFIISNGATAGDYKLVEDSGGTPVLLQGKIYTAVTGGAVINYDPCIRVSANQEIGVTSTTVTTGSYTVCGYTAP